MRLPVIPIIVAAMLLTGAIYLFNSTEPSTKTLDIPRLSRFADIEGTETEVAIAPDGNRIVVVVSGDLWLLETSTGSRRQLTHTAEAESFPAWSPDGKRISFSAGSDTLALDAENVESSPYLFRENATSLSFSPTGRLVFVRNRALWLTDALGQKEAEIVSADPNPDIELRAPHFSPDSIQVAFIKSLLNLRGQVWTADVLTGMARPLVYDRAAENPLDLGWIMEGKHLAYLTNRAGAYSIWQVDFIESVILPLTPPLVGIPLERIGMSVWKDRIMLPRHFVDSNIELSDGTRVAGSEHPELEPAVSPNGRMIAYTIAHDNKFEIWTAGIQGEDPVYRTLGREPRFATNGFQVVYTHTDLTGNEDIWRVDLRNGDSERITDAEEIDIAADVSPDGKTLAFSSARGGPVSVWTIPTSGGKRLRITDRGYAPRYSGDGRLILFWNQGALWTMDSNGGNVRQVREGLTLPTIAVWSRQGPAFAAGREVHGPGAILFSSARPLWPSLDVLPDGRFVVAPIDIRETGLWVVDLIYKEN
jgi:Tol biopolymer transport system component